MTAATLNRQTFTTSREMEYFTESELTTQTGHEREDWWPRVVVKELVDNALDACEMHSVAPAIYIALDGGRLTVADNGPGIPGDVVSRILDYSTRTSDKQAYVSPTRGAQGNALKTTMAIPFVLNGGRPSTAEIEAQGLKHVITVATDHITRRPDIDHQVVEFVKKPGTTIRLQVDSPCAQEWSGDERFLQNEEESDEEESDEQQCLQALIQDYALFNPHTLFILVENGTEHRFEATAPDWKKWLPTDPTSAHWYSPERLEDLVASYIAAERTGAEPKTVRAFIAEFRGLSSTGKQKKISAEAGLERAYLRDLVAKKGQLDKAALARLLEIMQRSSAPVKPDALGVLGESHFRARLTGPQSEKTFRYKRYPGTNDQNLPFVVEVAFCLTDDPSLRGAHIGLNWSGALGNPLQEGYFAISNDDGAYGFSAMLEKSRINISRDPVCLVVHLICPRFKFLDRGKGSVAL